MRRKEIQFEKIAANMTEAITVILRLPPGRGDTLI